MQVSEQHLHSLWVGFCEESGAGKPNLLAAAKFTRMQNVKLKTLLLLILFLLHLTPMSFAQTQQEFQGMPGSDLGIEPGQSYQGTLVLELLEAAEAEIEAAVTEAYAEGYKAAMLRFAPELAAQKTAAVSMQLELDMYRKKRQLYWPAAGIAAGFSFAAGFFIHSLVSR